MVLAAALLGIAGVVYGVVSGDVATALAGITSAVGTLTSGNDRIRDHSQEVARMNQQFAHIAQELAYIKQRVDAQAVNDYQVHMIKGGRLLLGLPVQQWYYQPNQHQYEIICDAHRQFVSASAVARNMGDAYRTAHAELAIFSCCLLLQRLQDAQTSLLQALTTLEKALLNCAGDQMARAYIDVLRLCQECGDIGPDVGIPVDPVIKGTDGILAVNACRGRWVSCLGVSVYLYDIGLDQGRCCTLVTLRVANMRWPEIKFSLGVPRTWQTLPPAGPKLPVMRASAQEDIVQRFLRRLRNDPPPSTYLPAQQPATNPSPYWQSVNQGFFVDTTLPSPTVGKEVAVKVQLPFSGARAPSGYPGTTFRGITFLIPWTVTGGYNATW